MVERPSQQPDLVGEEIQNRLQHLFDEVITPHVREGEIPPITRLLQHFIDNGTISSSVAQVMYFGYEKQWRPAEIAIRAGVNTVTIRELKRQGLKKLPTKVSGQFYQLP